jgi:hypothetical protein
MLKWVRVDIPHVGVSMAVIGFVRQPQSGHYALVTHDKGEPLSQAQLARYEQVHLRCVFCEHLVEVRNGAAGKAFICFDCVDAINQLRAESPGSSAE